MAFTEFYCNPVTNNGNMCGGDGGANVVSTNGDWHNAAANRFTAASGTPFSGVIAGQWAQIYADGSTTPVYLVRVTAVGGSGAYIDCLSSGVGTRPGAAATGMTANVGGVWAGPNGTDGFPFGFITVDATNASSNPPRVNLKNNGTYSITAGLTHSGSSSNPVVFRGYASSAGDTGRATIAGPTGASFVLLTMAGTACPTIENLVFDASAFTSGNNHAVLISSVLGALLRNCVFHGARGAGFNGSGVLSRCEAYNCNRSNTAAIAGFNIANGSATRCISHHNTGGTNAHGFYVSSGGTFSLVRCVSHANGGSGFAGVGSSGATLTLASCDAYDNDRYGLDYTCSGRGGMRAESCNFVANGLYGIDVTFSSLGYAIVTNCGFGGGAYANTSGATNYGAQGNVDESGTVNYTTHPWADPDDGDFRISSSEAKGQGVGNFTQTQSGYGDPNPTVAYPDIGAAQHQDSGTTGARVIGGGVG